MELPEIFVTRMRQLLGNEFENFISAMDSDIATSIRANPKKITPSPNLEQITYCKTGFYLKERPIFTLDPFLHSGVYYVQESSSMFLEQAIKAAEIGSKTRILDLSAAPGGKSTHLASLISDDSLLVSNEVIRSRAQILSENLKKWGNPNVVATNNDPKDFERLPSFFDVVVVDAPCSGEGLFRRDANAISEWSVDNMQLCAQRQKRILADIWPSLKENGILIYSTCTFNPEENEENIRWLKGFADIEPIKIENKPGWGVIETENNDFPCYRFYPHKTEGEGFFMAIVRKKGGEKQFNSKKTKNNQLVATKVEKAIASKYISSNEMELVRFEDAMLAFPANLMADLNAIKSNLRIVHAGVKLGEFKQTELLPAHELALSTIINRNYFPEVELSLEQALTFLKRDEIRPESQAKGWNLFSYRNIPIGWAKNLGNRFNNAYPKEWRIRMDISAYQGDRLDKESAKFPF